VKAKDIALTLFILFILTGAGYLASQVDQTLEEGKNCFSEDVIMSSFFSLFLLILGGIIVYGEVSKIPVKEQKK